MKARGHIKHVYRPDKIVRTIESLDGGKTGKELKEAI